MCWPKAFLNLLWLVTWGGGVRMQARGEWTEDYARWRRRNSIAPDAKVPFQPKTPFQLAFTQK